MAIQGLDFASGTYRRARQQGAGERVMLILGWLLVAGYVAVAIYASIQASAPEPSYKMPCTTIQWTPENCLNECTCRGMLS